MRQTVCVSKAHNYIVVSDYHSDFKSKVVDPFCRRHLYKTERVPIPGTRDTQYRISHKFIRYNADKTEFRICRSLLKPLIDFAQQQNYHQKRIKIVDLPELSGVACHFEFNEGWGKPREHQVAWLKYQLEPGALKINNMSPGQGKTFCALSLMIAMGVRTVITIAPRYIPVWIKALGDIVNLQPRDVILIEGDLIEAAQHIRDGIINPKVIILPLTKLEVFLRKTEETPCGVDLDDIYKWMGAGLRIQDEAHEAIHQVYLSMLYGNFKKTLALSGTLESDDPFTNKIYKLLYPKQFYLQATEYKKYLNIIAYHYYMDTYKHKLKTQSFGGYSDTAYEKSILKSNKLFEFYYQLTKKAFDDYYIKRRREKSKCLIFFSKVDMCERMQARFKRDYPDMDIISFTGTETKKAATKDKYLKHEIVISTPGSCGTGKDIKGLITCICMHTVSSMQRNDQILMRLRELFDIFPDMDPLFVYGVNWSIAKHRDYHYKRKELFEPKSKGQYLINSQMYI